MYRLVDCGGLHGHIKVGRSGIIFVPNKNCGGTQGLIVSMDNGLTFAVEPVTGSTPGTSDPSLGVGSKGRTYFGYVGGDGHPHISISDDQGRSWRSEEHTSELQSPDHLVCRLLLEKKKKKNN